MQHYISDMTKEDEELNNLLVKELKMLDNKGGQCVLMDSEKNNISKDDLKQQELHNYINSDHKNWKQQLCQYWLRGNCLIE